MKANLPHGNLSQRSRTDVAYQARRWWWDSQVCGSCRSWCEVRKVRELLLMAKIAQCLMHLASSQIYWYTSSTDPTILYMEINQPSNQLNWCISLMSASFIFAWLQHIPSRNQFSPLHVSPRFPCRLFEFKKYKMCIALILIINSVVWLGDRAVFTFDLKRKPIFVTKLWNFSIFVKRLATSAIFNSPLKYQV